MGSLKFLGLLAQGEEFRVNIALLGEG